jgi:hypothetical protein
MKQDRRAVSVTWVSSFTLVVLVLLLLLITGGVSASKVRSWYKYPDINPWRIGSPSPRSSHTMVAGSDGALWSFGGELVGGSSKSGELFKLDIQTEEWTTITTSGVSPSGRSGHTMGHTDGFLWVFGGETDSVGETSGQGETETRNVCYGDLSCVRIVTWMCHVQVEVSLTSCGDCVWRRSNGPASRYRPAVLPPAEESITS